MEKERDYETEELLSCEEELEEVDLADPRVEESPTETRLETDQDTKSWRVREHLSRFGRWWPMVELKALVKLALPTVILLFFQQFVFSTAVLFAGHVSGSSRELDSVSLAISVSNVTGFVVVIGVSSAADTLCPQSFGAKNYKRVGEVYQQGLLILTIAVLPVIALWLNSESLLLLLQQPPCVVRQASQFLGIFTLILPPFIILIMTQRYLQAQSVVWLFTATSLFFNVLAAALCSLFIYGFHLGVYSIAVAMVISAYLAAGCMLLYIKVRGLYKLTWPGWSLKSLDNWWVFLKLGLPGFCMIAFEWWTYEISVLVSGSLSETDLGVNIILLQLLTLFFMFPLGTGTAVSVRVGNELGAGNPLRAKRASYVAVLLQLAIVSVLMIIVGLAHNVIGGIFTSDPDVIKETGYTVFAAMVVMFSDQIQGTISGVFRGAGLQTMAACINFVVFYVVGLPIGISLAVLTDLNTLGMWIGLSIASFSQVVIFLGILFNLNWDKLTAKAQKNAVSPAALNPAPLVERLASLTKDKVGTEDKEDKVKLVSFKNNVDSEDKEPLITETSLTDTPLLPDESPSPPESESSTPPESESTTPIEVSSPGRSRSCLRGRAHLLLCRGAVLLVGVCLVVISGALTVVLRHDELESACAAATNSCCGPPVSSSAGHWTLAPSPSCSVCSTYSQSAFAVPQPTPFTSL